jgi:hypothetical protein
MFIENPESEEIEMIAKKIPEINVYGKLKVPKVASKNTQYCR